MAKKYFNNYRLELAYDYFFNRNLAKESIAIHDAVDITSGENLPKSKMTEGPYAVYGGGGETSDTHISFNIDYDTIGIGRVGARCGCVFNIKKNSWVTDNALVIKSCDPRFSLQFLRHFLSFKNLGQFANDAMQPVISKTRISGIKLPLLSLKEQQSIAEILDLIEFNKQVPNSFIDQLDSKLKVVDDWENLSSEITNQKLLLSQLKQAIFQEAIQGKLTADWRAQNSDVEPASELLKRIKAEKEKLVKEKKIKKEKPLPPITAEEIPFELPEGWAWCRMQESGLYERGKSKHRPRNDARLFEGGDIPFVQTGEVAQSKHSEYLINSCSSYYNAFGLAQSRLWPKGTMCITIAANIAQTGFLNIDACFPDSVVGFTALSDSSIAKYIRFFIDLTKTDIEKYAPATAQKNINLGIIYELKLPLPPEEEIKAIVQKVDALMEKCRILEAEITQSEAHAQMLIQAVLKEAFEPAAATEPEDEEGIAMAAEPAEAFGKQGEFGF